MKRKIIAGIILVVAAVAAFVATRFLKPAVANKQEKYFYIHTGENVETVKQNLVNEKFIKGDGFDFVARLLKYKTAKPGRYKLKDRASLLTLIRQLRSGDQSMVKLVIIKERTKELFAGKFGQQKKFDTEFDSLQMIRFLNNNDSLKKFGVDTNTVLSVVLPLTYETKWNTSPGKVFQQFYTAYKTFWTPERKTRADSLHLTPLQVISLASIVEEETNKKADKYNIASTYLNRVRTGMKLQADPTIKYALKNFALKRITGAYLQTNSPYNTYMYAGIPPGPICTPTAETIDAVLNAPKTDYLYFVASHKFDGTSIFTTNYDDHMKYARLYQQELTRRMDSANKAKAGK
jgi:UPF0755 protein